MVIGFKIMFCPENMETSGLGIQNQRIKSWTQMKWPVEFLMEKVHTSELGIYYQYQELGRFLIRLLNEMKEIMRALRISCK